MRISGCFFKAASIVAVLIAAALLLMSCGAKEAYPSVSSILENWLEIKKELASLQSPLREDAGRAPEARLDAFGETLSRFFASPVSSLYTIHRPGEMQSLASLASATERLKTAARSRNAAVIYRLTGEMDSTLDLLRRIDIGLLETSQINSFRLFFFFSALIIAIIAALRLLYSRLEITEKREQGNLVFSRENLLAQEEERARIARELHDTVAQDLWRLSFQTDSIVKAENGDEQKRLCAEAVAGQKELMQRVRDICDGLIPPAFGIQGLDGALRSLCFSFAKRTGIACEARVTGPLNLSGFDKDTQIQCFRVAQECLSNIEKHSGAVEALAELRGEGDVLVMCVTDNGKGFSVSRGDWARRFRITGHFGLWNMYERAAALGGTLAIKSGPETGTTVTLRVPMPLKKEEGQ